MATINATNGPTVAVDVFNYYEKYEESAIAIEKTLNFVGYFPIYMLSGHLRMGLGAIQLTHALALTIFASIKHLSSKQDDKYQLIIRKHVSYMTHACANIARGLFESIHSNPLISALFLVGYDHLLQKRFKYESERT